MLARSVKSSLKGGASAIALTFVFVGAAAAGSLPSSGQYVAGKGTIAKSGSKGLSINQSSTTGIIDWNSFSIGKKNSVDFNNGAGATLNRVTGGNLSSIAGSLHATGSVYVINSAGVMVGKTGRIDTGGTFAASSGDASNGDFMGGKKLRFHDAKANVSNAGSITSRSGDVILIGHSVSNSGSLSAEHGSASLNAGTNVYLAPAGTSGQILVSGGHGNATNSGTIAAAQAQINAAGGNVYALSGNNGGVVRATGTSTQNGHVWLTSGSGNVTVSGNISAQNADGSGGRVTLRGGDIANTGSIDASATHAAKAGGDISIIARNTTTVGGAISAKGGNHGSGGHIETSGAHVHVANSAKISTLSANGKSGDWLIDPTDFTIAASGGDITGATLSSELATTNVTIESSQGLASGSGDINVNDAVTWSSAKRLTLDAYRDINVNTTISVTGAGGVGLIYGDQAQSGSGDPSLGSLNFGLGNNGFAGHIDFGTTNSGATLSINGTPYTLLYSMAQIEALNGSNVALQGNYALAKTLDASSVTNWVSIGYNASGAALNSSNGFSGSFEGLGHTVSNLTVDAGVAGLFGISSGKIENVGIIGGSFTGQSAGALVVNNDGTVNSSYATSIVYGVAKGDDEPEDVGGLIGVSFGSISNSFANGNVIGGTDSHEVGGLVGLSYGAVENSHATGAVSGQTDVGGLLGGAVGAVADSYATGSVTGLKTSDHVGGLAGTAGNVSGSYATGDVTGWLYVGGLIGESSGPLNRVYATGRVTTTEPNNSEWMGGLVGQNNGNISHAYATGDVVAGGPSTGGFVGENNANITQSYSSGHVSGKSTDSTGAFIGIDFGNDTITASYFDSTNNAGLSGTGANDGSAHAKALTDTQMRTKSSFSGWTFGHTVGGSGWVIVDGDGTFNNAASAAGGTTPMLISEYSTTIGNAHALQLAGLDLTASYTLANTIDASGTAGGDVWGPSGFIHIGSQGNEYSGTFNGDGHAVTGLTEHNTADAFGGMFYGLSFGGVVENFGLVDVFIDNSAIGGGSDGAIIAGFNDGTITNVYSTGTVMAGGSGTSAGIAGFNDTTITHSWSSATITGTDGTAIGGIAGVNNGAISTSYATGNVTVTEGNFDSLAGGLVGLNNGGTIATSYASGKVTTAGTDTKVGGFAGTNNGTITASYYNSSKNTAGVGGGSATGVTGLSSSRITHRSSFVGWTFGALGSGADWVFVDNDGTLNDAGGVVGTAPMLLDEYSTTINNAHQLQLMALNTAANYTLATDINAASTRSGDIWSSTDFIPVGGTFTGTFDGEGHTISNLRINSAADAGLFRTVGTSAVLRDVMMDNATVSTSSQSANAGIFAASSTGLIENVVVSGSVSGGLLTGGLVGNALGGTILASGATASVTGKYSGGLVGGNDGRVLQSWASGSVNGTDEAGGLVGDSSNASDIENSYATGTVNGGFDSYIGGLIGEAAGIVKDSYATGAVVVTQPNTTSGGLIGILDNNATVSKSYWDTQTTGMTIGVGADDGTVTDTSVGKTTAALQGKLPSGFSSSIWGTGAGLYPYLQWQFPTGTPQSVSGKTLTGYAGTATGNVGVGLADDGALLSSALTNGAVTSGANGYYYILLAPGSISSGDQVMAFQTDGNGGAFHEDATGSLTGLNIADGFFTETLDSTKMSTAAADIAKAVGGIFQAQDAENAPDGTVINSGAASFNFNTSADYGTTLVIHQANGTVTESGNITASNVLLTGNASYKLTGADNDFSKLAAKGSGALSVKDNHDLTVTSVAGVNGLSSRAQNITLATTGAGHDIFIKNAVTTSGTVTLNSAAKISESGDGKISAATLKGSSVGAAALNDANVITYLGPFNTGGNFLFELTNAHDLTVAGSLATGSQNIHLTTTGAKHDISVQATVSTSGTVYLNSAARIIETSAGKIKATTLKGSSAGVTELNNANAIANLGTFTTGGDNAFALTDASDLTVTGALSSGSENIQLTTTGTGHDIFVKNVLTTGGTVDLTSAATIQESGAGKIVANKLTGSSVGATSLGNSNAIEILGDFNTGGNHDLALVNAGTLTITGTVNTGTRNIALTTTGAGSDIAINGGTLTAATLTLTAGGEITESAKGSVTATKELNVTARTGIDLGSSHNHIKKVGTRKTKSGPNVIKGIGA